MSGMYQMAIMRACVLQSAIPAHLLAMSKACFHHRPLQHLLATFLDQLALPVSEQVAC